LASVPSESLRYKLVALKKLADQREELQRAFKKEQHTLQTAYEDKYKPVYNKRNNIIEGIEETNDEDISADAAKVGLIGVNVTNQEKGIPGFWGTAIGNCFQFKSMVNDKDRKILYFLRDVRVLYLPDNNFSLIFHFSKNEFFEHETLTKTFKVNQNTGYVNKIESTEIQWKTEDLNPTIEKKKKKVKKKNEVKTITKVEEVTSFFNFFKNYEYDETKEKNEKKDEEKDEEEEEEDEQQIIDDEYDLGLFVKDDFIPFALEYFLDINPENDEDFEDEEIESEEEQPKGKKGGYSKLKK